MCLAVFFALTWPVDARDDKLLLPITVAMETKDAEAKLDGSVKFFFGQQKSPAVVKKFGNYISNLKTNAVGKSDEKACNWVFLSTLLSFEKRAKELGANAVVNIVSYYQKKRCRAKPNLNATQEPSLPGWRLRVISLRSPKSFRMDVL
jgi:hypothetical protein